MEWLNGKKTILGGLALTALGAIYFLQQLLGQHWLNDQTYQAATAAIGGFTAVSMRIGIQKAEDASAAPPAK